MTLADYWGVPKDILSEKEKRYGVSLILFNTPKAKALEICLKNFMDLQKISPQIAVANNQALREPSTKNPNRKAFFGELSKRNFDNLVIKYNWKYYVKMITRETMLLIMGERLFNRLRNRKR